jgi:hypothetical protein
MTLEEELQRSWGADERGPKAKKKGKKARVIPDGWGETVLSQPAAEPRPDFLSL